jgi:hypothetical protein
MYRTLSLTSKFVNMSLALIIAGRLIESSSADSLPENKMSKDDNPATYKQKKFNFEAHQTAESAEAALRSIFPNGAKAADFLDVLTQAGARCVKEPIAPYLESKELTYLEKNNPDLLLKSRMLHCSYSKFVGASVATEWDVKTAEYPEGTIKGLRVSRFLVGP